jgi:HEAT repeat protein
MELTENPMNEFNAMSTEDLVRMALAEEDEDKSWNCVMALHVRGTHEVFKAASTLCQSHNANERRLGADILGQLGSPERPFTEEALVILHQLVTEEKDPRVLNSTLVAIGHTQPRDDQRAVNRIAELRNHPNSEVRYGVVHALSGREDVVSISALLELMRDEDNDVRNWATFGIGTQIDAFNTEISNALWERTKDQDYDTFMEAVVGLARRKDERVYDVILREVESQNPSAGILEAAGELGDTRLLEPLRALLKTVLLEDDIDSYWLSVLRRVIDESEKRVVN